MKVLDMNFIRYLNLFEKVTHVQTKYAFNYNNMIIFAVPDFKFSKAIGRDAKNVKQISYTLGKRIKIVKIPSGIEGAEKFFSSIVNPYEFKSFVIENGEIVISASRQNKAGLLGRNKMRLKEMQEIADEFFGKKLKIV